MKNLMARQRQLILFWLFNYPLFCILFLAYGDKSLAQDTVSLLYFILLSLGHAGLISWLLLFAAPYLLYWASFKRLSAAKLALSFAVTGLFCLVLDAFTYLYFRTHINMTLLAMMLSPARGQIFALTMSEYLSLSAVFALIFMLQIALYKIARNVQANVQRFAIFTQVAVMTFIILTQSAYAWADAVYEPRILLPTELSPGFFGITAKRFFARYHLLDVNNRQAQLTMPSARLQYPLQPLQTQEMVEKPNILVIAIDAWRYDGLNEQYTPNIAAFSERASHYTQHYSGGNCTRAGLFSLFYSVNPGDFDAFYQAGIGPVLFNMLYRQGYEVGVFPSASAISPPFHRTAFVNVREFEPNTPGNNSAERDKAATQRLKEFMRKSSANKKPYFAFIFYDSAHSYTYPDEAFNPPFKPAARVSHLSLHNKKAQLQYRNQYYNALYFIDGLVKEILSELSRQNSLDNTLIVFTSDHGEEFDDNGLGYWGHNSNFTAAQTHVPMVVHWPRQHERVDYQHVTSHYDFVPTLLQEILKVKNPLHDYSLGKNLNSAEPREIILLGSYAKTAVFSPLQGLVAITHPLGFFRLEDLHGRLVKTELDHDALKLAFTQINHFHNGKD
ncbi:sulfatase-like hydrolase/transferase [Legionella septentrionalis]|uniref:sulfatase-like hydrolase/transferase n=1 Tax=Legionella septentrionalis TaxID=2498109 RepID=UPI000F8F2527|nr:sulfatase-like hydrolase/transferase [Legionella septentrionalis]RUR14380.1 DUF3413 domain-containing protein [Legionella septentrionalis]